MDIDPDTSSDKWDGRDDPDHGGFRPAARRKEKQSAASIQVMSKKRRERAVLRQTMCKI